MRFLFLLLTAIVALVGLLSPVELLAEPSVGSRAPTYQVTSRPPGFTIGKNIQGKIDFWKLIFTKYGEKELVFHHREHPEIIYSVLDLTDLAATTSGKEFAKLSNQAISEEYARIRQMLTVLADGGAPKNAVERRLDQLFSHLPQRRSAALRDAMTEENLRYQRGIKEKFRESLVRSGRHLASMEHVFVEEGLPPELTRLPFIESSFDYNAYSSVGAAGIWQFMRGTGKKYLHINAAIDERREPLRATRAAARYLRDAYNRLQSWPLAITSYNHGVSGILRAAKSVGSNDLNVIIENYNGSTFGFASKNFYAEFMAALEIERNPGQYFSGLHRENPWSFEEVKLHRAISFSELARAVGLDESELAALNLGFMQPVITGRARIPAGYAINLPIGKGRGLISRAGGGQIVHVENFNSQNSRVQYSERQGSAAETEMIAAKRSTELSSGSVAPDEPRQRSTVKVSVVDPEGRIDSPANKTDQGSIVTRQAIPISPRTSSGSATLKRYRVERGDTLSSIAAKFKLSLAKLRMLNKGLKPTIKPGQQLIVG